MQYDREGVENALENEFGVRDLTEIISYLEELSTTEIGKCEICGEAVYADEFMILPEDIECAHGMCINSANKEEEVRITKGK